MNRAQESAVETLQEALREMEKSGYRVRMVGLNDGEIRYLLDQAEERDRIFEAAYQEGFDYGYKTAMKDVLKKIRGLAWYGGDYKKKRAAGMPGVSAGADEAVQQGPQGTAGG